jgi:hypothetical protein
MRGAGFSVYGLWLMVHGLRFRVYHGGNTREFVRGQADLSRVALGVEVLVFWVQRGLVYRGLHGNLRHDVRHHVFFVRITRSPKQALVLEFRVQSEGLASMREDSWWECGCVGPTKLILCVYVFVCVCVCV